MKPGIAVNWFPVFPYCGRHAPYIRQGTDTSPGILPEHTLPTEFPHTHPPRETMTKKVLPTTDPPGSSAFEDEEAFREYLEYDIPSGASFGERLAALAKAARVASEASFALYALLVAPPSIESQQARADMARMSGCALVIRALWRLAGLDHHLLTGPYQIGHAVSDVVQVAKDLGAWRKWSPDYTPALGDVILVGQGGGEHVYTVVYVDPSNRAITSVDGGQRRETGEQCLRMFARYLDLKGHDVRGTVIRPVVGIAVAALMQEQGGGA